jgi:UDPglucose--hexose-1-phosphate uridylyltransferase
MQFTVVEKEGVQYRSDPLTGGQTRLNPARATRPMASKPDVADLVELVKNFKERDPFAEPKIYKITPEFPESWGIQDDERGRRVIKGETVIFPNKFPFGGHHMVAVMSKASHVPIDQYSHRMLSDALSSMHMLLNKCVEKTEVQSSTGKWYPIWVWNYLPPSAGSLIHPHMQMMMEDEPCPELRRILAKAAAYTERTKSNYYKDLIDEEEKTGERFVGRTGSCVVLAPFAPRGANELHVIFPDVCSVSEFTPDNIKDFSTAIQQLLKAYHHIGIGSFNMASFSGPVGGKPDSFSVHFKFWSRPFPSGIYTNDTGPTERMYDTFVINTMPELYAEVISKAGGWSKDE